MEKVEWVVLDEADRMLELGYEREVTKVRSLSCKKISVTELPTYCNI